MKRTILCVIVMAFALTATAQELNVASFNVRNNAKKDYENNNGWDQRKAILCDMINFEAFDIFGSQEVKKEQLDDMLGMLPDYKYIGVGRNFGDDAGEFCPVFYRKDKFRMLDGGTFWLSPTPDVPSKGWDAKYNRICTWGMFVHKESGKKICFVNTHFDHRGVQARIESAKQIIRFVKERCKGFVVIVSGDFNVSQISDSYKTMATSKVLQDSYELAKYRFVPTGTFNGFNPNNYTDYRIDHLFVSKDVKVSRWGVLAYHYYRDMKSEAHEMVAAPKEINGENRDVKMISDHYAIQAFVSLK